MIFIRILLVSLIVYLVIRSFFRFGEDNKAGKQNLKSEPESGKEGKKISKGIGEYIDYEEIKENDR